MLFRSQTTYVASGKFEFTVGNEKKTVKAGAVSYTHLHTFVTEILSDFVYTLKTAYDKSLQVKLGGDTQVEVHIQCVVVGDEGACACTAGDGLQNRCFHFRIAGFVDVYKRQFDMYPTACNLKPCC